ncbi:DUF4446 family protein [Clostridium sp. P21]|uniref:DUF4446 family protein n=1 Tax=Clostridium muellerianum TaxID=2716538 RepID=A0A7Y0HNV4_9CLOT|nr:DUF4446 family protein [Clostridium muellerianum]NMM62043.1 DUF4446 family protein [Clostridium muellerianum]
MQNIIGIINNFQVYIIAALFVLVVILLIMVITAFKSLNRLEGRYRKFMRGVDNKNLEELITGYLDKVDKVEKNSDDMKEIYKELDTRLKGCIQKVSVVRYRAFEDVGSDLSFSISLLDENNDGVIITGIYGRNESTTYAKPVDRGISRYDLSEEEKQVLQNSINKV